MEDLAADRITNLLALLLLQQMKASPQHEKVVQLRRAGFSNVEIADLLNTTAAAVAQSLYESGGRARKRASKRPRVRKKR